MKPLIVTVVAVVLALAATGCERNRPGMSDAAITAEVKREIGAARLAGTIDAMTQNGVVTLTGSVPDDAAKAKAEDTAERVAGVARVQNNLRVTAAADAPNRPAMNLPPQQPAQPNAPPAPEVR